MRDFIWGLEVGRFPGEGFQGEALRTHSLLTHFQYMSLTVTVSGSVAVSLSLCLSVAGYVCVAFTTIDSWKSTEDRFPGEGVQGLGGRVSRALPLIAGSPSMTGFLLVKLGFWS